jgi:uncharacterized protein (TIGR03437 family)
MKKLRIGVALCSAALTSYGQISGSAYRVLGQPGLQQTGTNLVQGTELSSPSGAVFDGRGGVYISDTGNHRVLGWAGVDAYQSGMAPTVILGQPGRQSSAPMGIGARGMNTPVGVAADPRSGDLYVADFGNNRVLRFLSPFQTPSRVEPDAVVGQADFTRTAAGVARGILNRPRALAFDSAGNLWVADAGNHRVVRFSAASLSAPALPEADLVIGQRDFVSSGANGGGAVSATGLDTPAGLAFDTQGNLYIADLGNARVLKFTTPLSNGATASAVWGQNDFRSRVGAPASASTVVSPSGLSVDIAGNIFVASTSENRVLVFTPDPAAPATTVLGQTDFNSTVPNAASFPLASPGTLSGPRDVKLDAAGNVLVVDAGNHRVLLFSSGARTASRVWGQIDFFSNGINGIKPSGLNTPLSVAVDYSSPPFAVYVADTANHRVLGWRDSVRFRTGDPADFVIGQPDLRTGAANFDTRGAPTPSRLTLSSPSGVAVGQDGVLYVADTGNNRVLRFRSPARQTGRILPDAVLGQSDFTSAASAAVSGSSLRSPGAVAVGPDGAVFVADTGNHRVLEFSSGSETGATAVRVYGQPNAFSATPPTRSSAQTLLAPEGLFVDPAGNLFVADTGADRVVVFPNTAGAPRAGATAAFVIGHAAFDGTPGGTSLRSPGTVTLDRNGDIFVADTGNHRVLVFPPLVFLPAAGGTASAVVGQRDLTGTSPNMGAAPSAEGLFLPHGIFLDRQDTLYVADSGNQRVLHFLKNAAAVNAATFQSGIPVAPGGLVALFGEGFADSSATAEEASFPLSLAGREIVINDEIVAPLQFIGPNQANLQIPSSAPVGAARIAVRVAETGELIAGSSTVFAAVSPGLFTTARNGRGQAAALNQDGRINSPANPAVRGSVVTLFGTGQGQVSPPARDGFPAPPSPLSYTVTVPTADGRVCVASQPSMCVAVGNAFGDVQFSGLAPGLVGVWQINVRIPADVTPGDAVQLRVLLNGTPGNIVTVAVR